ncbi:MAG: hypothetical protein Q7J64_03220 [Elusimicrobiota bacterium]|nr:hypothetical protein [Elusimicrobiota bacterium]
MRNLTLAVYAFLAYLALRAVLRWLLQSRPRAVPSSSSGGDEMVLDPQCGAYVLKEKAVTRVIKGELVRFCGPDCAGAYEKKRGA